MPQPRPWSRRDVLSRAAAGAAAVASAGIAAAQSSAAPGDDKAPPLPKRGTRIELPEVPMFDGTVFGPEQAKGQVLVVYWWASWCPFCAIQSPLMEKLWREHGPRGLRMLGLSIDRKPADATTYLAKRGYTFPSGLVTPAVAKVLPKPKGLPVTYVRGRDERLLLAEAGQLFPEDVEAIAQFL